MKDRVIKIEALWSQVLNPVLVTYGLHMGLYHQPLVQVPIDWSRGVAVLQKEECTTIFRTGGTRGPRVECMDRVLRK